MTLTDDEVAGLRERLAGAARWGGKALLRELPDDEIIALVAVLERWDVSFAHGLVHALMTDVLGRRGGGPGVVLQVEVEPSDLSASLGCAAMALLALEGADPPAPGAVRLLAQICGRMLEQSVAASARLN